MEREGLRFIRLNQEHTIKPFDCDDSDLNDFFLNDSILYTKSLLTVTYILESDTETIAFFSVLNDKIDVNNFPSQNQYKKHIKLRMPPEKHFKSYPAVKIGRLGVSKNHQNKGYGKELINFTKNTFISNNRTGCRFITVDAYNKPEVIAFYERNGFIPLPTIADKTLQRTVLMFFDLHLMINP